MLVSHKRKFVFVHIYKTAGTSVAKALSPFTVSPTKRRTTRVLKRLKLGFPSQWDCGLSVEHKTAAEAQRQMGREVFEGYFSFAFVRNPWDWQVSVYSHVLRDPGHPQHDRFVQLGSFERYVAWLCDETVSDRDDRCQCDFLIDQNGEQIVDFVGRFETLASDFGNVCRELGIAATLPKLNVGGRDRGYREFYNETTAQLIAFKYARDIERFGYRFDHGNCQTEHTSRR